MKKLFAWIFAVALIPAAYAHGDLKPAHGGQIAEGKAVTVEVTIDPSMTMAFLSDHGKNVDSTGTSGEVTLLNGSIKSSIKLSPSGGNSLMGAGAKLSPGAKAIIKITRPTGGDELIRVTF